MTALSGMVIDGIAASEAIDSSGEVLDIDGCDISELEEGRGILNWEHRGDDAPGASPNDVVGRILSAKKIFREADCDNDRQRKYWRQIEMPFIYIVGRLFDGSGHPGAQALAAIIRDYKRSGDPILVRYSIEGSTLEKKGNRLVSCVARRVACTIKPCNRTCGSDIVEDPNAPDGAKSYDKKAKKDLLDLDDAEKSEVVNPMYTPIASCEVECDPEIIGEDLDKALSAGVPSAAPGALIGGAALQVGPGAVKQKAMVNQAMAAMRDFGKVNTFNKLAFKSFVKSRLPEASDDFIDHFADVAEDYQVKRQQLKKKEAKLKTPAAKLPAPKTPPKAATPAPKKVPAKKPAEVNEEDADDSVVKIDHLSVRGIPCEPITHIRNTAGKLMKMRGGFFDKEAGAVITQKGAIPFYNPDRGVNVVESKDVKAPIYRMSEKLVNGKWTRSVALHVPPGTDMSKVAHNPKDEKFRERFSHPKIDGFWSGTVMPYWAKVHELARKKQVPEEIMMHSAHFSMMSPNTPVRSHEFMHAHAVDTWEDHGVDPRDPHFDKTVGNAWIKKGATPNLYPRLAEEYFRSHPDIHLGSDSLDNDRKQGDTKAFMLANNKRKNVAEYHRLHPTLMQLHQQYGADALGFTKALMDLKAKQNLWKGQRSRQRSKLKEQIAASQGLTDDHSNYSNEKYKGLQNLTGEALAVAKKKIRDEATRKGLQDHLTAAAESSILQHPTLGEYKGPVVNGLAPKTGTFTAAMAGAGNAPVLDTHMIRHLHGMDNDLDADSLAYLKSAYWNTRNYGTIYAPLAEHYAETHPAVQLVQNHPQWKHLFERENASQAAFPAMWRHWCTIAGDEQDRGLPTGMARNEESTHLPFILGIEPFLKSEDFEHTSSHELAAKTAGLHKQYEQDYGEVPASMMYFVHLVPHLLEAAEERQSHHSLGHFMKATKLDNLDIQLRKAIGSIQSSGLGGHDSPAVYSMNFKVGDREHAAGRFAIMGGNLHHLEDYHGLLGKLVPEGPVTLQTVSRIHGLKMSPDLRISRQEPEPEENPTPAAAPLPEGHAIPTTAITPKPRSSVWDYQRAGMDKPHTLEVNKGVYMLDGNTLSYPEVSTIITNLRNRTATIRYKSSETERTIQKMETLFTNLAKAAPANGNGDELMDPGAALTHIRQAVANGHLPPEVERAMTRHIYEDKMTPGMGNQYAAGQFLKNQRPGVYVQMDGNDFKAINDLHGHEAGDNAIKAFGKAARDSMDEAVGRDQGKLFRDPNQQDLYRNGGDEFFAHVPSHEHAAKFARLLSQKLQALPAIGGTHKLSMSFGFGNDVHTADQALYQAKTQKLHPGTKNRKYEVGQVPNLAHSLVPGHEGPLPVHDEGAAALHATLKNPQSVPQPRPVSAPQPLPVAAVAKPA